MKGSANNSCISRVTVRVFYLANDLTFNNSLNDQVRLHYQSSSLGQGWRSSLLPSAPSVALVARYDTRSVRATSYDSKGQTSWRHHFSISHLSPSPYSSPLHFASSVSRRRFLSEKFPKNKSPAIYLQIHINTPHRLSR